MVHITLSHDNGWLPGIIVNDGCQVIIHLSNGVFQVVSRLHLQYGVIVIAASSSRFDRRDRMADKNGRTCCVQDYRLMKTCL